MDSSSRSPLVLLCRRDGGPGPEGGKFEGGAGVQIREARTVEEALEALEFDRPEGIVISGSVGEILAWSEESRLGTCGLPVLAHVQGVGGVDESRLLAGGVTEILDDALLSTRSLRRVLRVLAEARLRRDHDAALGGLLALQRLCGGAVFSVDLDDAALHLTAEAAVLLGVGTFPRLLPIDALFEGLTESQEALVREWFDELDRGRSAGILELQRTSLTGSEVRLALLAAPDARTGARTVACAVCPWTSAAAEDGGATAEANDPSTGLPGRNEFMRRLAAAMQATTDEALQLAVLYIEIETEDGAGEQEREQLIAAASRRIRDVLVEREERPSDPVGDEPFLGRVGPDRLAIVLREQRRSQDAFRLGRRLRESVEGGFELGEGTTEIDLNIGIAIFPGDAQGSSNLVKAAEDAMYCAKQQGRNNIQFFTSSMNTATFEALTLEASLRRALERQELVVYYQPKIELATNRIVGMEALVRWKHPELGMVSPAQFIPVAEETGLIIPIGEYVLSTACRQSRAWQDAGLAPVRMAVNISSVQFRRPDLFDTVVGVLEDTKLDADWLELEITESVLLRNVDATISALNRLKRAGIHLSIDDFGTGYSSLSYLKRFPVDTIKVDQSFIRDVTTNPDDASITTSIILMGHSLKLRVVAEGVETKSQLAFLRVLECDEVQGYYYSPPVPAAEAQALLARPFPVEA